MTEPVFHITVINPNLSDPITESIAAAARSVVRPGTVLRGVHPTRGVATVESHAEEAWAALGVIEQIQLAQSGERNGTTANGTDVSGTDTASAAWVIACFGDTGLDAAREIADGPVVGMTEAALSTAAALAHRFSIITMPPRTVAHSDRVVRRMGLEHRCVVRAVDVDVDELEGGSRHLLDVFVAEAREALRADGAEAIILGCAGLADLVDPLRRELGVPVVEGVAAAVAFAEGLLAQGLGTSRVNTYAPVPDLPAVSEAWT